MAAFGGVAPPAGAWIEITSWLEMGFDFFVAPPAGAWIEITKRLNATTTAKSRLPQARGLKSMLLALAPNVPRRASRRRVD